MLYYNRFIIPFPQVIYKKQIQKKPIFNLIVQYLEKQVQQLAYRGWHWMNSQEPSLTGGRSRDGRWESWRTVSTRRGRASCSFAHTWQWWSARLHLSKFETCRFVCRGPTSRGSLNSLVEKDMEEEIVSFMWPLVTCDRGAHLPWQGSPVSSVARGGEPWQQTGAPVLT